MKYRNTANISSFISLMEHHCASDVALNTNKARLCPLYCFFFFSSPWSFLSSPLRSYLPFTSSPPPPSDATLNYLLVKDKRVRRGRSVNTCESESAFTWREREGGFSSSLWAAQYHLVWHNAVFRCIIACLFRIRTTEVLDVLEVAHIWHQN